MSWSTCHFQSEYLAGLAEEEIRKNNFESALQLYRESAEQEQNAFDCISENKLRTRGITAVSAVSLWFKANEFHRAKILAYKAIGTDSLPDFAIDQLEELLQVIQVEEAIKGSGVEFTKQVLISVSGGEVVRGGAPLDLINKKVDEVGKLFYRTIEMLLKRPLRKHGPPSQEVQEQCRPWLFQAPAGSYQFAVRIQKPAQLSLFPEDIPDVEIITQTFFEIIGASTQDVTGEKLSEIVQDREYQNVFLKLTQNLAPGEKEKSFNQLEIRMPSSQTRPNSNLKDSVILRPESRDIAKEVIKKNQYESRVSQSLDKSEEFQIKGILRGLQLDNDWLEVKTKDGVTRITHAGDVVDDVIGPMVNRRVAVDVIKIEGENKYLFRDIQMED